MPKEFLVLRDPLGRMPDREIVPGALRSCDVEVNRHVPPEHHALPAFLERFEKAYSPAKLHGVNRVIACAASHHRLAWIHPFLDGNGRVTRLFTHAYLLRAKIDGHRLWTVTRGLGRQRDQYFAALTLADASRQGDLDGRGNLSDQGLSEFCSYFLRAALDQIKFMTGLLELDGLESRIMNYLDRLASSGELREEAKYLVRDVLLRGSVPRGEAGRITGTSARLARDILHELLARGLLASASPKGPLVLALPTDAVGYYFPRLYPPGVEVTMGGKTVG